MAAFAAFPPLKMVTVVDDDVDIRNASDVEWAMATRLDPKDGIIRIDNVFGHGLNPSFPDYLGSKLGFDCCRPWPHTYEYERAAYKPMSLDGIETKAREIAQPGDKPAKREKIKLDKERPFEKAAEPKAAKKANGKHEDEPGGLASGGSAM